MKQDLEKEKHTEPILKELDEAILKRVAHSPLADFLEGFNKFKTDVKESKYESYS